VNVLFVTQYFPTPDQPGQDKPYQHVKSLTRSGHRVDVITTYVLHKERKIPPQYRGQRVVKENHAGATVYKVYAHPDYGKGAAGRMRNYLSFMMNSVRVGLALRERYDVVIGFTPPLFAALAAYVISLGSRARFVLYVRDLWVQAAQLLGFLKNPCLILIARLLESFIYRRAKLAVVGSEHIQAHVQPRVKRGTETILIPYCIDPDALSLALQASCPDVEALPGGFVAVYSGAVGVNNDIEVILGAACELRQHSDIHFVIIGDGDHRAHLETLCRERRLDNVHFLGAKSRIEVLACLNASDLCLLPVKKVEDVGFEMGTVPSKLFDYLVSDAPIVATASRGGAVAKVLEASGGGLLKAIGDPHEMAAGVLYFRNMDPEERTAWGRRGRQYVLAYHNGQDLMPKLEEALRRTI